MTETILLLIMIVNLCLYVWFNHVCDDLDRAKMSDMQYAAIGVYAVIALLAGVGLAFLT